MTFIEGIEADDVVADSQDERRLHKKMVSARSYGLCYSINSVQDRRPRWLSRSPRPGSRPPGSARKRNWISSAEARHPLGFPAAARTSSIRTSWLVAVREVGCAPSPKRKRRDVALILPDYCTRIAVLDFDNFPSDPKEQVSLVRFRLKERAVRRGVGGGELLAAAAGRARRSTWWW